MTTTEPTLRFHQEVDQEDVFGNFEYVYGEDGPEQSPLPDPDDLPFDAAACAMCGNPVGGIISMSEDRYGNERESGHWIITYRGPLGVVCEDCIDPAEQAVARLLRSDWFLPAYTALRFYLTDHPDTVLRDWFTAANLPE
jgi:hypothetical protein